MTPYDVPGPLGLEWLTPWLQALVDADAPQDQRVAGEALPVAA